jgi:hypothetical protein
MGWTDGCANPTGEIILDRSLEFQPCLRETSHAWQPYLAFKPNGR